MSHTYLYSLHLYSLFPRCTSNNKKRPDPSSQAKPTHTRTDRPLVSQTYMSHTSLYALLPRCTSNNKRSQELSLKPGLHKSNMSFNTCSDLADALAREKSTNYQYMVTISILGVALVLWFATWLFLTLNPAATARRNRNSEFVDEGIELEDMGHNAQQQGPRRFWARFFQ